MRLVGIEEHVNRASVKERMTWLPEAAARLDVPIYLHPAPPPKRIRDIYYTGAFPPQGRRDARHGTVDQLLRLSVSGS